LVNADLPIVHIFQKIPIKNLQDCPPPIFVAAQTKLPNLFSENTDSFRRSNMKMRSARTDKFSCRYVNHSDERS
jgi:hypothetical protein